MRKALLVITLLFAIIPLFSSPSNAPSRRNSGSSGLAQKAIPTLSPSDAVTESGDHAYESPDAFPPASHASVLTTTAGPHSPSPIDPKETGPEKPSTIPILALVFGCLSLLIILLFPFLALPFSIAGIILGAKGMERNYKARGLAVAGFILSILGFLVSALFTTIFILFMLA